MALGSLFTLLRFRSRKTSTGNGAQPSTQSKASPQRATPIGRALLIGCNYGELKGTENDVSSFANILNGVEIPKFNKITRLTGCRATRKNIKAEWNRLICESNPQDAVVIYFSGHGGYAEPKTELSGSGSDALPSHFQYLVPHDFDGVNIAKNWKGILDIQITRWLHDLTNKTQNVTYVLDCCHAARLGKDDPPVTAGSKPPVAKSISRELENETYVKIWQKAYKDSGAQGQGFANPDYSNPNVVRIAAAAAESTAWQKPHNGRWVGAMTETLVKYIVILRQERSWQNIMAAVGEYMKLDFSRNPQQPRSAGADDRRPFSMESDPETILWATIEEHGILIQGGRALGMEPEDKYQLQLLDSPNTTSKHVATISKVDGFTGEALPIDGLKRGVAFATPHYKNHPILVELCPSVKWKGIQTWLEGKSGLFRRLSKADADRETADYFFRLQQDDSNIILYGITTSSEPVSLGSFSIHATDTISRISRCVEKFTRARKVIKLPSGELKPLVTLNILNENGGRRNTIHVAEPALHEPVMLAQGERVSFKVTNNTERPDKEDDVRVSLLNVDATGEIDILSLDQAERGILLTRTPPVVIKRGGWEIKWPDISHISQHFMLVLTKKEVDLRFLQPRRINYLEHVDGIVEAKGDGRDTVRDIWNRLLDGASNPYHCICIQYSQYS